MRKLLPYLKPYRKECIISPLFKLFEVLLELIVPLVVAKMIDSGLSSASDRSLIIWCFVYLVVLGAAGFAAALSAQFYAAKAAVGFATKIKSVLFSHILSLSCTELDGLGTATLVNRLTTDVNLVQTGTNMALRLVLRSPFVVFGAMIMALTISPSISVIFIGLIILLGVTVGFLMAAVLPRQKKVQSSLDTVLGRTEENLDGVRVLRAFGKQKEEIAAFEADNHKLFTLQNRLGRISSLMNPLTYTLVNAALVVLLLCGGKQVNTGQLTQGQIIALVNYLSQILVELLKLANLIVTITKALSGASRIEAVLSLSPSMHEADHPKKAEANCRYAVCFDHVCAAYASSGDEVLTDISFALRPGQKLGIIGPTGSGKSTLASLIPRLYDASKGSVSVLGQNVKDWQLDELRRAVTLVPQKSQLIHGTIRDNLLWGNASATDDDMWKALEDAQAAEFVREKPGGLDAAVLQEGRNYSGGQKQRLCVARALLSQAPILILDDCTSALDMLTEAHLQKALKKQSCTIIIISQRVRSVRNADYILVLDDGCAVGFGSHDELMQRSEVYREIVFSQNLEKKESGI